jgi:glycyl-tRNA synthetase beta chain
MTNERLDLLFEIGAEEVPASYVLPALADLDRAVRDGLSNARLGFESADSYATPRRLALVVRGIAARQDDLERDAAGPPAKIAFGPDGAPTKAALGFAKTQGVEVSALEVRETDRGPYVFARVTERGRAASDVIPGVLSAAVASLSFPKTMRWGPEARFARPIRWIVASLGGRTLDLAVAGVRAGDETRGHRAWSPGPHRVTASDYVEVLGKHFVVADHRKRRALIEREAEARAAECGGRLVKDDALLDEVTFLVESPTVFAGRFDERFLALPRDVIIAAMKGHQRYFAVESAAGGLLPHFLCVMNGPPDHVDGVRRGNERVLVSRLDDAEFYWHEDTRSSLADKVESLRKVVWLEGLGSLYEKTDRLEALSKTIAAALGAKDAGSAARAARLAKADLVTEMVKDGKEFTTLQGVMGREYARVSGEPETVALAVYEHYLPRFAGDGLPSSESGTILSIADRLDSIAGCFSAGLVPSGSQDPYALRRQAIGVIRLIDEKGLRLGLGGVVRAAVAGYPAAAGRTAEVEGGVLEFLRQRARNYFMDEGFAYDLVDAVLEASFDDLAGVRSRLAALSHFRANEDFAGLVTGARRVNNILKGQPAQPLAPERLVEPAEKALEAAARSASARVTDAVGRGDFDAAVRELLGLRLPIDSFFDGVMVMVDDEAVRNARLGLLAFVRGLFLTVADFARVVLEGEESGRQAAQ